MTMRKRSAYALLLAASFLFASPALAFLDVFDVLKIKLNVRTESSNAAKALEQIVGQLDKITGPAFEDVPENSWYGGYVRAIAKWNMVKGYKDAEGKPLNRYGPDDPVTYAQFLKMAFRAAKINEKLCAAGDRFEEFKDRWFYHFLLCAAERNFRLFQPGTTVHPDAAISRAEVLVILHDAFGDELPPFSAPFTDAAGHPYERDIAYAHFRGVITGDTDESGDPLWLYRPDEGLNRAEAAKLLYEQLRSALLNRESGEAVTININVSDFAFSPKTIRVKQKQFVTLNFHTTGIHTFTSPALVLNEILSDPMQKISFYAAEKGMYPFQCAVEGHKEKGMEGVMIIE